MPSVIQRPIGVTAFEDKIVQQALVRVLESVFEEDFLGFSEILRQALNCRCATRESIRVYAGHGHDFTRFMPAFPA